MLKKLVSVGKLSQQLLFLFLNFLLGFCFNVAMSALLLFGADFILPSFEGLHFSVNESLNFPILSIIPVLLFLLVDT